MKNRKRYHNVIGVDDAVGALTGIASTIAGISDANKRRDFQEKVARLTTQQQQQLNYDILRANTQTEKLSILNQGLTNYAIAVTTSASSSKTTLIIVAACMAGVLLIGGILLSIKGKHGK